MTAKARERVVDSRPDLLPELIQVQGWTRNLKDVSRGSKRNALWRCSSCGGEWWQSLVVRLRAAAGCKACRSARRRLQPPVPAPGASLAEVMADVAAEWMECLTYPTATPKTISAFSGADVRWKCAACEHVWVSPVSRRVANSGKGCRPCANARRGETNSRRIEARVADACPEIMDSFLHWGDPSDPTPLGDVSVRSDRVAWWRCACGNTWHTRVRLRVSGSVCPKCRAANRRPRTTAPLLESHPEVADLFVCNLSEPTRSPTVLRKSSEDRCRWQCTVCSNEWEQTVVKVVSARRPCPRCAESLKGAPEPGRSLADLFQREAAEFVANLDRPNRGPSLLRPNSVDRCLWQCQDCPNQWESTVTNRSSGKGCPICGRRRAAESRKSSRASASFRETHPELAALFVANRTRPGRGPDEFTAGTSDVCVWRCSACPKTLERSVYTHSTRGLCARCGYVAMGVARRHAPREKSLAGVLPDVAASFVENLSWPGHDPASLFPRSTALCSWRCRCGATYEATVRQRTKSTDFGCGRCRRRGRSLLELEVAHLLAAATGDPVEVDFPVDGGRAQPERIDLFLPTADIYIDLDPAQWHSRPQQHAQDLRKSKTMAKLGVRYVRVRQTGTPPIPGETLVAGSKDSTEWFRVLAEWFSAQSLPCMPLSNAQITRSLQAARDEWKSLRDTPPEDSLAVLFPDVAKELVENLSRPEMNSEWLPAGSGDRCLWRCATCQHEWHTLVVGRTRSKTGCPKCAHRRRAFETRLNGKAPRVREVAPYLLAQVVRILDVDKAGGIDVGDLAQGSSVRVLWKCPVCPQYWAATIADRTSGRGCRPCGIRRRNNAAPGRSLADLFPDIAGGFIANLATPGRGPEQLGPGSQDRCRWRCPECDADTWEATVQSRVKSQGCGGCRSRRVGRPRLA